MLEVKFGLSWNYRGRKGTETLFHTAIGSFIAGMRDWSPAFKEMAVILETAVDEQFETGGQGKWAELSASTIARKGSSAILINSGLLRGSFRTGGAGHISIITRSSLIWGSTVPYAIFHQTGTGSGFQQTSVVNKVGYGLPMRKIIDLSNENKREMRSAMVRNLSSIARREGFAVTGQELSGDPLSARNLGKRLLDL